MPLGGITVELSLTRGEWVIADLCLRGWGRERAFQRDRWAERKKEGPGAQRVQLAHYSASSWPRKVLARTLEPNAPG